MEQLLPERSFFFADSWWWPAAAAAAGTGSKFDLEELFELLLLKLDSLRSLPQSTGAGVVLLSLVEAAAVR